MLRGNVREIKERINTTMDKLMWWFLAFVALTVLLYFASKFIIVMSAFVKICVCIAAGVTTIITAVIFGAIGGMGFIVKMLDKILKED